MTPRCDNCRFWEPEMEECRRHAPQPLHFQFFALCLALCRNDPEASEIINHPMRQTADFPTTRADEWCGEHEPKEPAA